jgi:DNA topoisomerase IA
MRLIVAEKPSVGRDIASALGRRKNLWPAKAGP